MRLPSAISSRAGADRRFRPDFVAGLGFGYGQDSTAIGNNGTQLDGKAWTLAMYGSYHPGEDAFLAHVAEVFGLDEGCFRAVRARLVEGAPRDPYDVLGLPRDATLAEARAAWKALVRDCHPDVMQARGLPPEAVRLAERRLIAINAAWAEISGKVAA